MSDGSSGCNCGQDTALQGKKIEEILYNHPGLSKLAYRSGTHGSFKSSMLKLIASEEALSKFTAREDDDPAVALIDAWAVVADVLSFYQERIANEGFIRTATERRSILELARAIGYELHPGVAAGTYLVFELETAKESPDSVKIPAGTKAQTVPGQDEKPQTFETIENVLTYKEWNAIKVKSSQLWQPRFGRRSVYLKGTFTNLKKGDTILIVGDERKKDPGNENWDFRRVSSVETFNSSEPEKSYTKVIVERGLGSFTPYKDPASINIKVYALRQRASLFGYNAPDWNVMPEDIRLHYCPANNCSEWPNFNIAYSSSIPAGIDSVYLDSIYPQIIKGSWIVISDADYQELYEVVEITEESRTNFAMSSKTSKLKLKGDLERLIREYGSGLRQVVVYGQNEELEIADEPITQAVSGDSVILDKLYENFFEGQPFIVSGLEFVSGKEIVELAFLKESRQVGDSTQLVFTGNLSHSYKPDSVTIYANTAKATHGESKAEILGSGDASKAFQKFDLKQKPLTYISASTPDGTATTLEIRVNDILWKEADSFYELDKNSRAYITRRADDGTITVQFGDGKNGSRLSTGNENISAKYRFGIGLEGLVKARQISQLLTKPLGVKSVINPIAPEGAADPQKLDEARKNAPLTVLTLDRIVSLQDFEDFSGAFAGIGKSRADIIWSGEDQIIHLTIAGSKGAYVSKTSDLYKNLLSGIDNARHPDIQVILENYILLLFNVDAKIFIDKNYIIDKVISRVQDVLLNTFSFEQRSFGQSVVLSEVVAVMQSVEGVIFVDLEKLYFSTKTPKLNNRLPADIAGIKNNIIHPAELILLNPAGFTLIGIIPL